MSWLDTFFFGVKQVAAGGVVQPQEKIVNFIGFTVADNAASGRTDVSLPAISTVTAPLTLTGTSDTPQLVVVANATQTTQLTQWKSSAGAILFGIAGAGSTLQWGEAVAAPTLTQAQAVTNANAATLTIAAQAAKSGGGGSGGTVKLQATAGDGAGIAGTVQAYVGATLVASFGATTSLYAGGAQYASLGLASGDYLTVGASTATCQLVPAGLLFGVTAAPLIKQSDLTTASGTGAATTIQAQSAIGTTSTGGALALKSGTGTTAAGTIQLYSGATNTLTFGGATTLASATCTGISSNLEILTFVGNGGGAVIGVQNQSATGYSGIEYIDNTGAVKASFNYANASAGSFPSSFRFNAVGVPYNFLVSGTNVFQITTGNLLNIQTATTTTTAPAAGGAGALPATPKGYITIQIAGTNQQIAYY